MLNKSEPSMSSSVSTFHAFPDLHRRDPWPGEVDSDQAEFTACCSGSDDDDQDLNEDDSSPALDTGFGNTIIVDTRPVIRTKKHDKLRGVIREICSRMGVIKEDGGGVSMPVDPASQKTLGYCFAEYNTPQVLV